MGAAAGTAQQARPRRTAVPAGVYRPRRPRASPLYRLIEDHFQEFTTIYDERFAQRWGYWRPVVAEVVEKYVACGILKHGFARVRCGSCKHEFLLAFSCKCRILGHLRRTQATRRRTRAPPRRWKSAVTTASA